MKFIPNGKNLLLLIILIAGALLIWSLSGFLTAFLLCIILYVLLKVPFRYLTEKRRWTPTWATVALMLLSFVTILVPFWILYQLLSSKVYYAVTHGDEIMVAVQHADDFLFTRTGVRLLSPETIRKMQGVITSFIPSVLGQTADLLANIGMMYFMLYYLLKNTGKSEAFLREHLPVKGENAKRFSDELEMQVYSNVLGAPLLATVQGISAGLCFWLCGLDEPWFWGTICGFMSFVPMVGTALVWLPAGIYQLSTGMTWQGVVILVYGALVITNIDNVFRFVLAKKIADVHPLITILGVITGLNWFGLPGIVFGPLLLSYFVILVKMYLDAD